MDIQRLMLLLNEYYKQNLIGVWLFNENNEVLCSSFEYCSLFKDAGVFPFDRKSETQNKNGFFMIGTNELYYNFEFQYNGKNYKLLLGPMLLGRPKSTDDYSRLSFYAAFSHSTVKKICGIVPAGKILSCISVVRFLILSFCGSAPEEDELEQQLQKVTQSFYEDNIQDDSKPEDFVNAYLLEGMLTSYVQAGDIDKVKKLVSGIKNVRKGKLSDELSRQVLCDMVCSTTLVTRAAIQGGMEPSMAYTLSDYFIQLATRTTDLQQLTMLSYKMLFAFTEEMQKLHKNDVLYSPTVRKCIAYISMHFNEKLTAEDIAAALHFSPSYIQHIFKQETGQTIHQYLQNQRIEEAKILLEQTEYTYAAISDMTGFGSQSYFTNVFRNIVGVTPKKYRENSLLSHN